MLTGFLKYENPENGYNTEIRFISVVASLYQDFYRNPVSGCATYYFPDLNAYNFYFTRLLQLLCDKEHYRDATPACS